MLGRLGRRSTRSPPFAGGRRMSSAMPLASATRVRVLPHELAFAALYAVVIARLAVAPDGPAWGETATWCVFVATSGLVVAWSSVTGSAVAWRVRLGAYLILMNAAYSRMGAVHDAIGLPMYDRV